MQEVFELLRSSFDEAHKVIIDREGGLTTLCACLVCPVKNSSQYAMCCLNVGDSYGYVFSHNQGRKVVKDNKCEYIPSHRLPVNFVDRKGIKVLTKLKVSANMETRR